MSVRSALCRRNLNQHLLCQLAADGQSRAANRTDQIPPTSQLPHLLLLAKPEIPQALTPGSTQHLNPQITSHPRLMQRQGWVAFQFFCKRKLHKPKLV